MAGDDFDGGGHAGRQRRRVAFHQESGLSKLHPRREHETVLLINGKC